MITTERLSRVLREQWGTLGSDDPPPASFSFLVITKGHEPVGKIVLMAFAGTEQQPRFVVKIARLKAQNRAIQTEYLNLGMIAGHACHGGVQTPKALLCWEEDGRLCLVETVIGGVDLWQASSRSRSVAFVEPIVEWLIHLTRAPRQGLLADTAAEAVAALVARADGHVRTEQERRILSETAGRLLALSAERVPRVFEHDDMGTWNLTVSPEGIIGILDWESSRPDGFPAWDLFYFLAHYGFMVHGTRTLADRLESFAETFLRHSPFGRVSISAVHRYADALGLSRRWLGPLFLGCWLHHTTSEATRLGIGLSASPFWRMLAAAHDRDFRLNFLGAD